jgi:hypothetical protein
MHYAVLIAIALVACACSSKDSPAKSERDAGTMHVDAGTMHVDAGTMHVDAGAMHVDAGAKHADAATPSALERATLPRPPAAARLPAELRPPR